MKYDSEKVPASSNPRSTRIEFCKYAFLVLLMCLTSFLSFNVIHGWIHSSRSQVSRMPSRAPAPKEYNCNCGYTIEQAKSNECKYDSLATSWLPPFCRDDSLTEEFEAVAPGGNGWTHYTEKFGNETYTLDEVATLAETKGLFYTTHEWHMMHCFYYWRKLNRARRGVPGSTKTLELSQSGTHHMKHCKRVWGTCLDMNLVNTRSKSGLNVDASV